MRLWTHVNTDALLGAEGGVSELVLRSLFTQRKIPGVESYNIFELRRKALGDKKQLVAVPNRVQKALPLLARWSRRLVQPRVPQPNHWCVMVHDWAADVFTTGTLCLCTLYVNSSHFFSLTGGVR